MAFSTRRLRVLLLVLAVVASALQSGAHAARVPAVLREDETKTTDGLSRGHPRASVDVVTAASPLGLVHAAANGHGVPPPPESFNEGSAPLPGDDGRAIFAAGRASSRIGGSFRGRGGGFVGGGRGGGGYGRAGGAGYVGGPYTSGSGGGTGSTKADIILTVLSLVGGIATIGSMFCVVCALAKEQTADDQQADGGTNQHPNTPLPQQRGASS